METSLLGMIIFVLLVSAFAFGFISPARGILKYGRYPRDEFASLRDDVDSLRRAVERLNERMDALDAAPPAPSDAVMAKAP